MRVLAAATHEASPEEFLAQPFASSEVFLGFLSHLAEKRPDEPVIAIVDELPYLADVDQGLLTARQNWWDEHKRQPNLKLFLAGSSIAFIERQVLDANAPLYNRRTGALKLEPLDYAEAARLFPRYSPREKIEAYAVLGGMPSYLKQFNSDKDLDENLLVTALQRNTYKDSSNESWHASSSRSTNMSRARPSRRFADNSCGVLTSPADYPLGSTSTPSELTSLTSSDAHSAPPATNSTPFPNIGALCFRARDLTCLSRLSLANQRSASCSFLPPTFLASSNPNRPSIPSPLSPTRGERGRTGIRPPPPSPVESPSSAAGSR